MDTVLIVLMVAACACDGHENSANLEAPFEGNPTQGVKEKSHLKNPTLPHNPRSYGNINEG